MVKKIGLTGGIASGKSTVGQWLAERGIPVIDADTVVHELLAHDPATLHWVRETFGDDLLLDNGGINRALLGQRVFTNPEKRRLLESWLHPRVREQVAAFWQTHQDKPYAVAMVPLIYETQSAHLYDEVWVVSALPATQLARLMSTRGMTAQQAQARIDTQWPLADKVALADRVIPNDGTPADLEASLNALYHKLFTPEGALHG